MKCLFVGYSKNKPPCSRQSVVFRLLFSSNLTGSERNYSSAALNYLLQCVLHVN